MAMLILLVIVTMQFLCNAQEITIDDDTISNETENCSCISRYSDLESKIKNNQSLLGYLREEFYTGGKEAELARIIYEFPSCKCFENKSSENIDNQTNCTMQQDKYRWSTSFIYLLGYKPLITASVFVILFPVENNITVHLPCICNHKRNDLLGKLTSMVSSY